MHYTGYYASKKLHIIANSIFNEIFVGRFRTLFLTSEFNDEK